MVIVCIDSVGRVQHQHQACRLLPQLLAGYTATVEGPLMDGYPVDKELEERSVAPSCFTCLAQQQPGSPD
jgi:hypothetical protein